MVNERGQTIVEERKRLLLANMPCKMTQRKNEKITK